MKMKALIFDLDNTVFSVYSVGNDLFKPLFDLIRRKSDSRGDLENIQKDIMRKPFQKVALEYKFSEALIKEGLDILNSLTADLSMDTFEDYDLIRQIPHKKFLVTIGFEKMQEGKIRSLGISSDFNEIHIIDPQKSDQTKKDIFVDIMKRHHFNPTDIIVVGDDPGSEIQAARELGIQAVLYDKLELNPHRTDLKRITHYKQLLDLVR
ncbi:MAG: HAD family hydrolase [Breznakibacter sp.]